MSTASRVRETWDLTGDDARRTLAGTGRLVFGGAIGVAGWTIVTATSARLRQQPVACLPE
jgi:hypothetical protein